MTVPPSERRLLRLPRERLHPDPNQPRKGFDPARLQELAASLAAVGQQQPLVVWESPADLPPGHYRIGDGERRWRAAPFVPLADLDCVVLAAPADRLDVLAVQLALGATGERLGPFELADGAAELMRGRGLTQEEVAAAVGVSPSKLSKAMAIRDHLAPELRGDVDTGAIPFTVAAALARLRDDPAAQVELAARAKRGLKRDRVEKEVAARLGKKKAGRGKAVQVALGKGLALTVAGGLSREAVKAGAQALLAAVAKLEKENWDAAAMLPHVLKGDA